MKKVFATAFLLLGLLVTSMAQTKSTGTNKDGSPDMRLKKNKDSAKAAQAKVTTPATPAVKPPPPPPATTTNPKPATTTTVPTKPAAPVVNPPNKSADKVVGTDAKGRTIYEGPRGGHYYINSKGNKEYVKKS